MRPNVGGSQDLSDPNRWQPLQFITFEDQAGLVPGDRTPAFLGAEWGQVVPFSLTRIIHRPPILGLIMGC